jgi:hypothetical protein
MLPRAMSRPDFWERRAQNRCPAEFDLEHPERVAPTYPADEIEALLQFALSRRASSLESKR